MLILLSLLACSGCPGDREAPADPKEAAAPAADPRLAQWFTPQQQAEIQAAKAAFDGITTPDAFAAALRQAVSLGKSLDPALQRQYDSQPRDELGQLDAAWLLPLLPGMKLAYEAEGTVVTLRPDHAAWEAKAKATPAPEDDAFVAAMALAYDNPAGLGWPRWTERTSDEGGCSRFGSGLHLQLLQAAEGLAAGTDLFKPEREALRQAVLQDIAGSERFPYCDPQTSAPTDPASLIEEAERILEHVELSMPEQRQVEARIRSGFASTPKDPEPTTPP